MLFDRFIYTKVVFNLFAITYYQNFVYHHDIKVQIYQVHSKDTQWSGTMYLLHTVKTHNSQVHNNQVQCIVYLVYTQYIYIRYTISALQIESIFFFT